MKLSTIKLNLKKILANFGSVTTDKGTLEYVGEELTEGVEVFVDGEVAPDGEYASEDGKVIVVASGVISEIKEPQAEETTESAEEEMAEESNTSEIQAEIDDIKKQLADLVAVVDQLTEVIQSIQDKLAEPDAKPAEEEFKAQEVKSSLFRS